MGSRTCKDGATWKEKRRYHMADIPLSLDPLGPPLFELLLNAIELIIVYVTVTWGLLGAFRIAFI